MDGSLETATDEIKKVIHENVIELNNATAKVAKSSGKNLLFNFACAIILTVAAICAYVYAQNYRDGTAIAEAKAVEALAAERAKFAKEMEDERAEMEIEFSNREDKIREEAVADYKKSNAFVIDGATYVANNIYEWRILETFYQEMPIKDKEKLGLHKWLIECHKEYKKKYGDKTPREF